MFRHISEYVCCVGVVRRIAFFETHCKVFPFFLLFYHILVHVRAITVDDYKTTLTLSYVLVSKRS